MSWWLCQQCGQWVDGFLHGCTDAQVAQAKAAWAVHDEVVMNKFAVTDSAGVVTIYPIDAQGNILLETPPLPPLTFPKPFNWESNPETPPRPRHAFVDNTGWRNAWAYCIEARKKSRLFDKEWWGDWALVGWGQPYAFKTREACDRRRAEFERTALPPGEAEFRSEPRYFGYDVTTALWYREDWVTILPCRG